METITYKEAANIMSCPLGTINNAVYRKVLTKAPSTSIEHRLVKDQVLLFKGKQFRKSMLSETELQQWEYYKNLAEGNINENPLKDKNHTPPRRYLLTFVPSLEEIWNGFGEGIYEIKLKKKYTDEELRNILQPISVEADREEAINLINQVDIEMSRKNEATVKMIALRLKALLREDKTTLLTIMLYLLALANHHDVLGLIIETSVAS